MVEIQLFVSGDPVPKYPLWALSFKELEEYLVLYILFMEQGMSGERWTMFFKDPSGNNLEFKAMTTVDNLFDKNNVYA